MKTICLYFEIHQITHLKRYRFFDIGRDHYYYDDFENERHINYTVENSYVPALNTILGMLNDNPGFKVAFSISGVGMEQMEQYAPQVLELLAQINATGRAEFLAEPYSHGLSSLVNPDTFAADVKKQQAKMEEYFGKKPTVLRNSSLIYSDEIGLQASKLGFKGMLTEGAKQVLGWKSPHYVYNCAYAPKLKLLMRDVTLSDDLSLRFNNSSWEGYPLFADNYVRRIAELPEEEQVINIFMELSALGIAQPLSSNILEFLRAVPAEAKAQGVTFSTPTEICGKIKSVGQIDVPDNISWTDEERDTSCWLGNDMQREAFEKLYSVADRVRIANDPRINLDWEYLQATENFRFMTTKNSVMGVDRGIFSSPFDAFTNYMNILGDFISRVNSLYPEEVENEQLNSLLTTIKNQGDEIVLKNAEIERLQTKLAKLEKKLVDLRGQAPEPAKKAPAKKAEPKPVEVKAPAKKAEPKKVVEKKAPVVAPEAPKTEAKKAPVKKPATKKAPAKKKAEK